MKIRVWHKATKKIYTVTVLDFTHRQIDVTPQLEIPSNIPRYFNKGGNLVEDHGAITNQCSFDDVEFVIPWGILKMLFNQMLMRGEHNK